MQENYSDEPVYSQLCEYYHGKCSSINELVIAMNKLSGQELKKSQMGKSDLSEEDAVRLLAAWIGIQTLASIARKNFSEIYKVISQKQANTTPEHNTPPLVTDADAPYSAEEIANRFWELVAIP